MQRYLIRPREIPFARSDDRCDGVAEEENTYKIHGDMSYILMASKAV